MAGRSPLDPPREVARRVLQAVRVDQAYANLELAKLLGETKLTARDAAFATELTSGTLRMQGLYDAIIASAAQRPVSKINAKVLDALRLGCHQLLAMRVPDHAAVNTTVKWVRHEAGPGAAGFANAVLRRVQSQPLAKWLAELTAGLPLVAELALRHSHPQWIVEGLAAALADDSELPDVLAANNAPAGVTLVARPGRVEAAELIGEPGRYSPYAVHSAAGNPAAITAVRQGRAGVQDEGSQLAAMALALAPLDGQDQAWLDLCAGPGGKAALLAGLAEPRGASLTAVEPHQHRADLVSSVVGSSAQVVVGDGRDCGLPPGSQDRVLVDAPCTGVGALRRRPEARWRKRPADLTALTKLQTELLQAAIALTRPGGVVGYVTCSPLLAETQGIVAPVVASGQVQVLEVAEVLPQVTNAAGPVAGTMQLWPHRHGTDAMFIALLRRV